MDSRALRRTIGRELRQDPELVRHLRREGERIYEAFHAGGGGGGGGQGQPNEDAGVLGGGGGGEGGCLHLSKQHSAAKPRREKDAQRTRWRLRGASDSEHSFANSGAAAAAVDGDEHWPAGFAAGLTSSPYSPSASRLSATATRHGRLPTIGASLERLSTCRDAHVPMEATARGGGGGGS